MPTVCIARPSVTFHAPQTKNCMNIKALSRAVSPLPAGRTAAPIASFAKAIERPLPAQCACCLTKG
ncbi:hypothetical protein GCM10011380_33680 [Sphingomonas metalli]|uniref:Uncharacterized protein n=1 Tax=Sphingomonas metalli TaxID=1779358 RepID=A0A916TF09_9SPHN|nr:hypothetical protein GCM10011380_33680 [Sphingomonas metalli]